MTGDDERDYDEEADVRRDVEREGLAELAAEQVAMEQAGEQWDEHAREVAGHMSGADHYREAERILAGEVVAAGDPDRVMVLDGEALFAAQVHATLALAAATALNIRRNGSLELGVDTLDAWEQAVLG